MIISILDHCLAADNEPRPTLKDGHLSVAPVETLQAWRNDLTRPRKRRVCVYMDFTQNIPSLASAIRVKLGFEPYVISGSTVASHRRDILQNWQLNDSGRVLIFTSVGSVGINLSAADTLIIAVRPYLSLLFGS